MRKRLVYRADDVGYTHVFNEGTFLALEKGIVTSVDVMFDTPGTMEVLEKLKEYPWLTIGWHRHLWGKPVLPVEEVPSMVDENGWFYWHHNEYNQDNATYEDCYKEFVAQLELCKKVLGKYPFTATAATFSGKRPIDKAMIDVCKEYNILLNPSNHDHPGFGPYNPDLDHVKLTSGMKKDLSINEENWRKKGKSRFDLAFFKEYDPASTIIKTEWESEDEIKQIGGHPGYLDDYIMKESTCTVHRIKELEACMDERVFKWIIDNKIELVNVEDAINGTDVFQTHLKEINSPLWIGNMK